MAMTHAAGHLEARDAGRPMALLAGAGWPLIVFIWAIFAALMAYDGFSNVLNVLSTDDAMRLAEVRDLLGGQSWWDLTQHRLNPPDGVIMHWSRVIDLPIAAILLVTGRLFQPDVALKVMLTLWPLLLLLPTLFAAASASRSVAGPQAGVLGAFLLIMSPGVTTRFSPGAIDHHGAQVALALGLLACALKLDRSAKAAVGAGLCAALMMAIGMETAPHVAACAALIAIRWAVEGAPVARGARLFGASFAAATAFVAVTTLSPESWMAPVCDTLGLGHLVIAALGGLGLAAATRFAADGPAARFAALAQVGVAVIVGLLISAPNCLSSPYGFLPERLQTEWLARVQEAQPFFSWLREDPTSGLGIGLPLLAAVAVAVWAVLRAEPARRWPVLTAAAMFGASLAVSAWQIRGLSLAFAMAAPLIPAAVLAIGRTGGDRVRTMLAVVALSPAALALVGLGIASAVGLPPVDASLQVKKFCPNADYRALAALPKGLALNTTDTGPYVIAFSPLSVVAAPYHRNVDGLMAELEGFTGSDEAARAIAVSRGAASVV
ncbi:MAG: hypothetical protein ABW275_08510, partial [Hansschlegelia sp.]